MQGRVRHVLLSWIRGFDRGQNTGAFLTKPLLSILLTAQPCTQTCSCASSALYIPTPLPASYTDVFKRYLQPVHFWNSFSILYIDE